MSFLFINKILWLNNLKTGAAINAKISVFVICVEAIIYLSLYDLHDCTFNNSFEFTPTETSAGSTLHYIGNHLSYKCRNDLNIYKKNELESTFIKNVNPRRTCS